MMELIVPGRIRERLVDLGIAQAEGARRCGIQQRAFNHYLSGSRRPDELVIRKICEGLRTHPNYLLGYTDNPVPKRLAEVRDEH